MLKHKQRFDRDDWIGLGLALLSQKGVEALTLQGLTDAAGKTRGSFYHHFEDYNAFLLKVGECWLAQQTDAIIADADAALPKGLRREALARLTADIDHALERELRRLAAKEAVIADIVAKADERRIAYLSRLFRSELGLDPDEALARARLQHCYFVGAQMVFPQADARFRLNLQKALGRTLWRK